MLFMGHLYQWKNVIIITAYSTENDPTKRPFINKFKKRVGILFTCSTSSRFGACPGTRFPILYVVFSVMYINLRLKVIACFGNIAVIVDHHCLRFLFIIIIKSWLLLYLKYSSLNFNQSINQVSFYTPRGSAGWTVSFKYTIGSQNGLYIWQCVKHVCGNYHALGTCITTCSNCYSE